MRRKKAHGRNVIDKALSHYQSSKHSGFKIYKLKIHQHVYKPNNDLKALPRGEPRIQEISQKKK